MKDTGKSVTLSYAVGQATGVFFSNYLRSPYVSKHVSQLLGNVQTTTVQLGGITVQDQAFCKVLF